MEDGSTFRTLAAAPRVDASLELPVIVQGGLHGCSCTPQFPCFCCFSGALVGELCHHVSCKRAACAFGGPCVAQQVWTRYCCDVNEYKIDLSTEMLSCPSYALCLPRPAGICGAAAWYGFIRILNQADGDDDDEILFFFLMLSAIKPFIVSLQIMLSFLFIFFGMGGCSV